MTLVCKMHPPQLQALPNSAVLLVTQTSVWKWFFLMLALGIVCLSLTLLKFLLDMSLMFSSCSTMWMTRGAACHMLYIRLFDLYFFCGVTRPKPPTLGGRARRSPSSFPGGLRPVRLGMSCNLMASSRG